MDGIVIMMLQQLVPLMYLVVGVCTTAFLGVLLKLSSKPGVILHQVAQGLPPLPRVKCSYSSRPISKQ